MADCCIIGGGIVGLSIARELAGRGLSVRVLARESGRDTASWAAAGIFPPAPEHPAATAHEKLTCVSDRLHRTWSEELRAETGIDNELHSCGGLHLAGDERAAARLHEAESSWTAKGARCDRLTARDVAAHEPVLQSAVEQGRIIGGLLLPEEMRIRPPRHLEALHESCRLRGVEITPASEVRGIDLTDGRIECLHIARRGSDGETESVRADRYCLAAGAWSGRLAESLGLNLDTRPSVRSIPRTSLAGVISTPRRRHDSWSASRCRGG
ncbi:MAG: NAD(P)/FAD-dependent oxidoreductase, partial [Planctomycetia bacterium]